MMHMELLSCGFANGEHIYSEGQQLVRGRENPGDVDWLDNRILETECHALGSQECLGNSRIRTLNSHFPIRSFKVS